jgi:hypothetical protein
MAASSYRQTCESLRFEQTFLRRATDVMSFTDRATHIRLQPAYGVLTYVLNAAKLGVAGTICGCSLR